MVQAFAMTLLGEWGDRSQLATVGLAAARSPLMVAAGGICGQGIAMALAAIGGQQLSHRISERVMSLGGGILFVVFGVSTAFEAVSLLRAA